MQTIHSLGRTSNFVPSITFFTCVRKYLFVKAVEQSAAVSEVKKHDFSIFFQTRVHDFLPMFETLHILDDGIIHQFFGFGGWFSWWGVLCSEFSITESKSITEIIFHKTKLIQVRRSLDLIGSGNLHSKSKWHNNSTAQ